MSIFSKVVQAVDAQLDTIITKAKSSAVSEELDRKGMVDLAYPDEQQYGWKEKASMVGTGVLKNMARKDSLVLAVINTRLSQVEPFTKPQKDRYSPGFKLVRKQPVDLTEEDKLSLSDPNMAEEEKAQKAFELEQKRIKLKAKEKKDLEKIEEFILHCGMPPEETDTTHKRWDFDKYVKAIVWDRLVYNYSATELIPSKDNDTLHHFYPVSAGTIKYVSQKSSQAEQMKNLSQFVEDKSRVKIRFDKSKPYKFVQVIRGRIVAAFTEDELIFEAAMPTVDPEDNGYAPGELELLVQIVTAHLYAEAHNRNFFTQGIGTKGILHIKGDNISRAQLEGFKRQWFNQVVNTRNAFRPPIIGMADDVKWVSLAQTNREMEFEQWMNYLIKMTCAIYQIDPAEINFDISKGNTSTLQEANNEERLKASKDKGLQPLLNYVENLVNRHILRYWDKDLADEYEFKFVGYAAESRQQEVDRLEKETRIWKTLNEARIEMGVPPLDDGNVVLNATYTQYKQMKLTTQQAQPGMEGGMPGEGEPGAEGAPGAEGGGGGEGGTDLDSLTQDLISVAGESATPEETKKSRTPVSVEYYNFDDEE